MRRSAWCVLVTLALGCVPATPTVTSVVVAPACGAAPVPRAGVRLRPMVQRELSLPGLSLLLPGPDGRLVAGVGGRETLLFDAEARVLLAVLPRRLLGWRDARHYYAAGREGLELHDLDERAPPRAVPESLDEEVIAGPNGIVLRRDAQGMALLRRCHRVRPRSAPARGWRPYRRTRYR